MLLRSNNSRAIYARIRRMLGASSMRYLSHTIAVYPTGELLVAHGYGQLDPSTVAAVGCSGASDWYSAALQLSDALTSTHQAD